jgi:hypothetical protein
VTDCGSDLATDRPGSGSIASPLPAVDVQVPDHPHAQDELAADGVAADAAEQQLDRAHADAVGFEDHPVDCRHCWELSNPAGGDFLAWDGLEACLPPKMREASFRRARLCQLTDTLEEAWLPPGSWAAVADPLATIPDGAEVVLAFDGSFNGDTTVLTVAAVAAVMAHDRAAALAGVPRHSIYI